MEGKFIKCPLQYYNCSGNILTNKLVSGYYTGQALGDGSKVNKPEGNLKFILFFFRQKINEIKEKSF